MIQGKTAKPAVLHIHAGSGKKRRACTSFFKEERNMKKLLSAVLSAAMIGTLLTGCGSGSSETQETAAPEQTETAPGDSQASEEGEDAAAGEGKRA